MSEIQRSRVLQALSHMGIEDHNGISQVVLEPFRILVYRHPGAEEPPFVVDIVETLGQNESIAPDEPVLAEWKKELLDSTGFIPDYELQAAKPRVIKRPKR